MGSDLEKMHDLTGKVVIITGGAGLLGRMQAEAVGEAGGDSVLVDIKEAEVKCVAEEVSRKYNTRVLGVKTDITDEKQVKGMVKDILKEFKSIDVLINNAANDPKVTLDKNLDWSRFENFPLDMWQKDISVALTGAFLCSREIAPCMIARGGVILNIASDLGVIAPDQRIYRKVGIDEAKQPVKPVTYSVVKHGIIGLTKYLATYWADKNIRVNAFSPGGIYTNQPKDFVEKITNLIPMKRMADRDEYKSAVLFLISEASSYMTGANLIMDGGRTCW